MNQLIFDIALAGPALFMICALVIGAITPKYSALYNTISEQALGKYKGLHAANYVVNGGLIAVLGALCLARGSSWYQSSSIVLLGAIIVLSAYYKTDPITLKRQSREGIIHNVLFLVGMVGIITGQFGYVHDLTLGRVALISGITALIGTIYTIFGQAYRGLVQRILVISVMAWVTVFALSS
ncbi:MAG TPA: DUF998 domain-containing protein [Candidatus Saccharimonadia bacterium]|jgi:hypothetical protein|nr:DUF998 domain-containing protein [Candidatus Saccharimonadia bacterium]